MTKCLKCGKLFAFPGPIYANFFAVKKKNTSVLYRYILKLVMCEGKRIFCTKVLTQRNLSFNGRWNMRCAFWKWAAVPICCKKDGSVMPHSDRRPDNFMLYLGTLHTLCLLCRTSFLPLIRWNEKYGPAAQISVISLQNRLWEGWIRRSSCDHLQIRLYSGFMLDPNIITGRKWNIMRSSLWLHMSCIWLWELRGFISSFFPQSFSDMTLVVVVHI